MAAPLSEDDFQCLQNQLLELKTKNYSLEERNLKYCNELTQITYYLEGLKKELAKAQKIIHRSKSARDVDQLIQENERLQNKIQSQEDEFRLQNETLMQEISSLVASNEKLQRDLELYKSQSYASSDGEKQNELIRLKAENAAMRKLIPKTEECENEEFPISSSNENAETDIGNTGKNADSDLRFKLEVCQEEKKILKQEMQKVEMQYKEELLQLQSECDKLSEKLKKKQESLLQLQEEKEHLYVENKKAYEDLETQKVTEVQQLKEQIHSMQLQMKQALQDHNSPGQCSINFQSENMNSCESEATVEFIAGEKASFESSLNETKISLMQSQEKLQTVMNQLQESELLVADLNEEINKLKEKNRSLIQEKSSLESALSEKSTLAEKRKNLIDEINNHLLETTNKHSKEIEKMTQQLANEQQALQKLFDKEKEARVELLQSRNEVQILKEEIERLKTLRTSVDHELQEALKQLEECKINFEKQLSQKDESHAADLKNLEDKMNIHIHDLTVQLEVAQAEKSEYEEKVVALQQQVKDSADEVKIQEKKSIGMVKDLKRQLVAERKRAEKLQERLQEILTEQNRPVDEILQTPNNSDKPKGDTSSVSSWSYVSGGTGDRDNRESILHSDGSSGGRDSPSQDVPDSLENETSNLLSKIAQLQQKNWTLEEKVNHLEMSNEALVDDVLKKTAIIQYYCMEGRSGPHSPVQDKLTIKRIVDFIKDRGDENLREMNRKMQRMLEETLTKNMHLQKDIETLSNEVSRLSKLVQPSVSSELQNAVIINSI